jgi:hypothetical protein
MKTTDKHSSCANFGQSAQDISLSMTNAAVMERAAQAFVQQRKADKAMRNATPGTPLETNLQSLLDPQQVVPMTAPTSIIAPIASTLRNAAPKMPKIDLKLPGLSATTTATSRSSTVAHQGSILSNKEHKGAIIGSNLAPHAVLEDSFENLCATKQRPSLVRRHSDSLLHMEPTALHDDSVLGLGGALLVDFPSKRISKRISKRNATTQSLLSNRPRH